MFRGFILLASSDNDEYMLMRKKMYKKIRLYKGGYDWSYSEIRIHKNVDTNSFQVDF